MQLLRIVIIVSTENALQIFSGCNIIDYRVLLVHLQDIARYIAAIKQVWYTVENQGMRLALLASIKSRLG